MAHKYMNDRTISWCAGPAEAVRFLEENTQVQVADNREAVVETEVLCMPPSSTIKKTKQLFADISPVEYAAVVIQSAARGHTARKALTRTVAYKLSRNRLLGMSFTDKILTAVNTIVSQPARPRVSSSLMASTTVSLFSTLHGVLDYTMVRESNFLRNEIIRTYFVSEESIRQYAELLKDFTLRDIHGLIYSLTTAALLLEDKILEQKSLLHRFIDEVNTARSLAELTTSIVVSKYLKK